MGQEREVLKLGSAAARSRAFWWLTNATIACCAMRSMAQFRGHVFLAGRTAAEPGLGVFEGRRDGGETRGGVTSMEVGRAARPKAAKLGRLPQIPTA